MNVSTIVRGAVSIAIFVVLLWVAVWHGLMETRTAVLVVVLLAAGGTLVNVRAAQQRRRDSSRS